MEKRAPLNERVFVLPLEGKGDRSAVDEVACGTAPLREALYYIEEYRGDTPRYSFINS